MAAFGPIEFAGIAVGRDIAIRHGIVDDMGASSSELSFSAVDVDDEQVTRSPLGPPTPQSASPPPSSPTHIVPEDMFLIEMGSGSAAQGAFGEDLDLTNSLAPLDRFAGTLQRHEKIAIALTLHTRIELPYQDYVPCPGSGPGSPALSVATDHIGPGVAPAPIEPTLPPLPVGKLALGPFAEPNALFNTGPTPMSRFLADTGPHEWMAPAFDNTSVLPSIELDDDEYGQRNSSEPSLTLDGDRSQPQRDVTPDVVEAGPSTERDDSHVAVLRNLELAASTKHGHGLKFEDAVSDLVKQLGDRKQERIVKQNLPRALRAPRMRESPPQKKRKTGNEGYQYQDSDS